MRILVFLLVLANLLFFAHTEGFLGPPDNPDALRVEQQVYPERVKVVARGEAPATRIQFLARDCGKRGGNRFSSNLNRIFPVGKLGRIFCMINT
jgi:hypothetical protein